MIFDMKVRGQVFKKLLVPRTDLFNTDLFLQYTECNSSLSLRCQEKVANDQIIW